MDPVYLFELGGPLMWPILGASVIAFVFFVERLLALTRERTLPPAVLRSLQQHLEAGDTSRVEQICRERTDIVSRIVGAGLKHRAGGRHAAKEAMEETGHVELGRLERGVGVISTVAAVAPLLGLLGTVTGMITVFRDIKPDTQVDIQVFADGIWQALITTAAGLGVAIVAFIAYRFVEGRIDRIAKQLEELSLEFLSQITTTPEHDASSSTASHEEEVA